MLQFVTPDQRPAPKHEPIARLRPDGRWEVRPQVDGKRHPEYGKTPEEAVNKWRQWYYGSQEPRQRSASSHPGAPKPRTVTELLDVWLDERVRRHLAVRTQETYADIVRLHLREAFDHLRLSDLTPSVIQSYFDRLIEDDTPTTSVARIRTTLASALHWAASPMGWIDRSPMYAVTTPRPRAGVTSLRPMAVRPPIYVPSSEEVKQFLDANRNDRLYALWLTGYVAGLRASELVGIGVDEFIGPPLRPTGLSVFRKMFVDRTTREFIPEVPKHGGQRILNPLPPEVMEALWVHFQKTQELEEQHPEWNRDFRGLLFRTRKGDPIDPTNLSTLYAIRCRRAGIPPHPPHVMRHYCASAMLERGLPPKRVASWLGHKGTGMVESTYGHLLDLAPNRLSEADVFADALGLGQSPPED